MARLIEGGEQPGPLSRALEANPETSLDQIFASLSTEERRGFERRFGPSALTSLLALARETDRELFFESLFGAALQLENADRLEVAAPIYQTVQQAEGLDGLCSRAGARLDAIVGRGNGWTRAEFLGRRLAAQASDPAAIVGMGAAGMIGRAVRLGTLGRLAAGSGNVFTRGLVARGIAATASLAVEAPAFTASTRGMNVLLGREQDWSGRALWREFASGALTLTGLKFTGALGGRLAQRYAQSEGLLARGGRVLIPQASMLAGIMLSHRLEQAAGLRERVDGATTTVDSFATLLQFNAAGAITHHAFGPGFRHAEQALDLQTEMMARHNDALPAATLHRPLWNRWASSLGSSALLRGPLAASLAACLGGCSVAGDHASVAPWTFLVAGMAVLGIIRGRSTRAGEEAGGDAVGTEDRPEPALPRTDDPTRFPHSRVTQIQVADSAVEMEARGEQPLSDRLMVNYENALRNLLEGNEDGFAMLQGEVADYLRTDRDLRQRLLATNAAAPEGSPSLQRRLRAIIGPTGRLLRVEFSEAIGSGAPRPARAAEPLAEAPTPEAPRSEAGSEAPPPETAARAEEPAAARDPAAPAETATEPAVLERIERLRDLELEDRVRAMMEWHLEASPTTTFRVFVRRLNLALGGGREILSEGLAGTIDTLVNRWDEWESRFGALAVTPERNRTSAAQLWFRQLSGETYTRSSAARLARWALFLWNQRMRMRLPIEPSEVRRERREDIRRSLDVFLDRLEGRALRSGDQDLVQAAEAARRVHTAIYNRDATPDAAQARHLDIVANQLYRALRAPRRQVSSSRLRETAVAIETSLANPEVLRVSESFVRLFCWEQEVLDNARLTERILAESSANTALAPGREAPPNPASSDPPPATAPEPAPATIPEPRPTRTDEPAPVTLPEPGSPGDRRERRTAIESNLERLRGLAGREPAWADVLETIQRIARLLFSNYERPSPELESRLNHTAGQLEQVLNNRTAGTPPEAMRSVFAAFDAALSGTLDAPALESAVQNFLRDERIRSAPAASSLSEALPAAATATPTATASAGGGRPPAAPETRDAAAAASPEARPPAPVRLPPAPTNPANPDGPEPYRYRNSIINQLEWLSRRPDGGWDRLITQATALVGRVEALFRRGMQPQELHRISANLFYLLELRWKGASPEQIGALLTQFGEALDGRRNQQQIYDARTELSRRLRGESESRVPFPRSSDRTPTPIERLLDALDPAAVGGAESTAALRVPEDAPTTGAGLPPTDGAPPPAEGMASRPAPEAFPASLFPDATRAVALRWTDIQERVRDLGECNSMLRLRGSQAQDARRTLDTIERLEPQNVLSPFQADLLLDRFEAALESPEPNFDEVHEMRRTMLEARSVLSALRRINLESRSEDLVTEANRTFNRIFFPARLIDARLRQSSQGLISILSGNAMTVEQQVAALRDLQQAIAEGRELSGFVAAEPSLTGRPRPEPAADAVATEAPERETVVPPTPMAVATGEIETPPASPARPVEATAAPVAPAPAVAAPDETEGPRFAMALVPARPATPPPPRNLGDLLGRPTDAVVIRVQRFLDGDGPRQRLMIPPTLAQLRQIRRDLRNLSPADSVVQETRDAYLAQIEAALETPELETLQTFTRATLGLTPRAEAVFNGLSPLAHEGLALLAVSFRGEDRRRLNDFLERRGSAGAANRSLEIVAMLHDRGARGYENGFLPSFRDEKFLSTEVSRIQSLLAEYTYALRLAGQSHVSRVWLGQRLTIDWGRLGAEDRRVIEERILPALRPNYRYDQQRNVEVDAIYQTVGGRRRLVEVKSSLSDLTYRPPQSEEGAALALQAIRHALLVRQHSLEGVEYVLEAATVSPTYVSNLEGLLQRLGVPYIIRIHETRSGTWRTVSRGMDASESAPRVSAERQYPLPALAQQRVGSTPPTPIRSEAEPEPWTEAMIDFINRTQHSADRMSRRLTRTQAIVHINNTFRLTPQARMGAGIEAFLAGDGARLPRETQDRIRVLLQQFRFRPENLLGRDRIQALLEISALATGALELRAPEPAGIERDAQLDTYLRYQSATFEAVLRSHEQSLEALDLLMPEFELADILKVLEENSPDAPLPLAQDDAATARGRAWSLRNILTRLQDPSMVELRERYGSRLEAIVESYETLLSRVQQQN